MNLQSMQKRKAAQLAAFHSMKKNYLLAARKRHSHRCARLEIQSFTTVNS